MNPDTTLNFTKYLVEILGQAGLYLAVIWVLGRQIKNMYEARLKAVEEHVRICDDDRKNLHGRLHDTQTAMISALRELLAETKK